MDDSAANRALGILEVVELVVSHLSEVAHLARASRINKTWQSAVEPSLYRNCTFVGPKAKAKRYVRLERPQEDGKASTLLLGLGRRPRIASYIRSLGLSNLSAPSTAQLLAACVDLEELVIHTRGMPDDFPCSSASAVVP